mgnify:CR=1 FL=1
MTAKVHRALTAILASLTGISALLAAIDPSGLGLDATTWAWVALLLSVATITATGVRQAFEA